MNEDGYPAEPEFRYRKNEDGTIDSICLHCYRTVCSCLGACHGSCAPAELKHKCNPDEIARLIKRR